MPAVKRPGMAGVYVELPESLRDRARDFAEGRGEKFAEVVRLALERHMTYPPPPPVVAPPPVVPGFPDAEGATTPTTSPAPQAASKPARAPKSATASTKSATAGTAGATGTGDKPARKPRKPSDE